MHSNLKLMKMNKSDLQNNIEAIWKDLEAEHLGVMKKVPFCNAPIFLMSSNNTKSFLFLISKDKKFDFVAKNYENIDIKILSYSKEHHGLTVTLTNQKFYTVFLRISTDIVSSAIGQDEGQSLRSFCAKLHQWEGLFSKKRIKQLSNEQQLGLYGELTFLKDLLTNGMTSTTAVTSWKGSDGEDKDFQFDSLGIEVKSSSKQDGIVKISNIRQLNETGFDTLFLRNYSFIRNYGGEASLPKLVEELQDILFNTSSIEEFELKLIQADYYHEDKDLYANTSYTMFSRADYIVKEEFPRITSQNVMVNVIDASYTIDLNACDKYQINSIFTNNVFNQLFN